MIRREEILLRFSPATFLSNNFIFRVVNINICTSIASQLVDKKNLDCMQKNDNNSQIVTFDFELARRPREQYRD